MATDQLTLDWWHALIEKAWAGDEQPFLFFFTLPQTETRTRKLDADGKRIVEYTWHDVPGEVRQAIVDLLVSRPFLKRGAQPAVDSGTAGIYRSLHTWDISENNPDKKTKTQSRKDLAKRAGVSIDTIRELLEQKKTYAPTKQLKAKKQTRR